MTRSLSCNRTSPSPPQGKYSLWHSHLLAAAVAEEEMSFFLHPFCLGIMLRKLQSASLHGQNSIAAFPFSYHPLTQPGIDRKIHFPPTPRPSHTAPVRDPQLQIIRAAYVGIHQSTLDSGISSTALWSFPPAATFPPQKKPLPKTIPLH